MTVVKHIFAEYVDLIRHSDQEKAEYDTLLKTYADGAERFIDSLTREQKSAALRLEAQRNLLSAMDEELMFCEGFRIGELFPPTP